MSNKTLSIPVVVHIVYNTPDQNIDDSLVLSQIEVLNEDYGRRNADAIKTLPNFASIAADAGIQFFLANKDPDENPTSGITRTFTAVTEFDNDDRMKFSVFGGKDAWRTDKYLNLWVCNLKEYLGYAQFPESGSRHTDGVVIHYEVFGRSGKGEYGLGRTATHEVGHWLGLVHTWGMGVGCGSSDGISDTPPCSGPHFHCNLDTRECGNLVMVQNFMDYSDDTCINLFTEGQADKMRSLFSLGGSRYRLLLVNSYCGNGKLEEGEYCDDGNRVSGDGCSVDCFVEKGFTCSTDQTSKCSTICNPIFRDNFEDLKRSKKLWVQAPFGWSLVSDKKSLSGQNSLYVPNPTTFSNYIYSTQMIQLPHNGTITLSFSVQFRTQLGSQGRCPDGLRVMITSDRFYTTKNIVAWNFPYVSYNDYIKGMVWCSYGKYEWVTEWKHPEFDLTLYAGQKIQIALQFVSDNQEGAMGFFIDDFQILSDNCVARSLQ